MGGKTVKKVRRVVENVHGFGKFGQTTWNRLQGDGSKKRKSGGAAGTAAGSTVGGDVGGIGGDVADAFSEAEGEGALSDARKRKGSSIEGQGPRTFGGYGTLGG